MNGRRIVRYNREKPGNKPAALHSRLDPVSQETAYLIHNGYEPRATANTREKGLSVLQRASRAMQCARNAAVPQLCVLESGL